MPRREKTAKAFTANKTKAEKCLATTRWGEENAGMGPFPFLSLALFPVLFNMCNQSLSTFALVIITLLELLHEPLQMYTQPVSSLRH